MTADVALISTPEYINSPLSVMHLLELTIQDDLQKYYAVASATSLGKGLPSTVLLKLFTCF